MISLKQAAKMTLRMKVNLLTTYSPRTLDIALTASSSDKEMLKLHRPTKMHWSKNSEKTQLLGKPLKRAVRNKALRLSIVTSEAATSDYFDIV